MKIFIDTAPFIYLIENHPVFAGKMKNFITDAIVNGEEIVTSVVTISEFGVKPTKENRSDLIKKFEELLARLNVKILVVDHTTGHFYKSHDFWGLKFPGRIPETGKIENICESNEPALL